MSEGNVQQDLGELQGKLELFMVQSVEQRKEILNAMNVLTNKIDSLQKQMDTYKTVAQIFKYIGLGLLGLLTFKLGDVVNAWHSLGELFRGN